MATTEITRAKLEAGDKTVPRSGHVYVLSPDGKLRGTLLPPTDALVRRLDRMRKAYGRQTRTIARMKPLLVAAEAKAQRLADALASGAPLDGETVTEAAVTEAYDELDTLYEKFDRLDPENPDGDTYGLDFGVQRAEVILALVYDGEEVESFPEGVEFSTLVLDAAVKAFDKLAFIPPSRDKG